MSSFFSGVGGGYSSPEDSYSSSEYGDGSSGGGAVGSGFDPVDLEGDVLPWPDDDGLRASRSTSTDSLGGDGSSLGGSSGAEPLPSPTVKYDASSHLLGGRNVDDVDHGGRKYRCCSGRTIGGAFLMLSGGAVVFAPDIIRALGGAEWGPAAQTLIACGGGALVFGGAKLALPKKVFRATVNFLSENAVPLHFAYTQVYLTVYGSVYSCDAGSGLSRAARSIIKSRFVRPYFFSAGWYVLSDLHAWWKKEDFHGPIPTGDTTSAKVRLVEPRTANRVAFAASQVLKLGIGGGLIGLNVWLAQQHEAHSAFQMLALGSLVLGGVPGAAVDKVIEYVRKNSVGVESRVATLVRSANVLIPKTKQIFIGLVAGFGLASSQLEEHSPAAKIAIAVSSSAVLGMALGLTKRMAQRKLENLDISALTKGFVASLPRAFWERVKVFDASGISGKLFYTTLVTACVAGGIFGGFTPLENGILIGFPVLTAASHFLSFFADHNMAQGVNNPFNGELFRHFSYDPEMLYMLFIFFNALNESSSYVLQTGSLFEKVMSTGIFASWAIAIGIALNKSRLGEYEKYGMVVSFGTALYATSVGQGLSGELVKILDDCSS